MIKQLDCEKYLNNKKQELKERVFALSQVPELIILNDEDTEENKLYLKNKCKHLNEIGIKTTIINERVQNIRVDTLTPCIIQKNKTFKEDIEYLNKKGELFGLFNIEYVNKDYTKVPTANGIVDMIKTQQKIDFVGEHCVIINRSEIIGIPLMHRLIQENAAVTIVNRFMQIDELKMLCKKAKFIFSGTGKAYFIDDSFFNHSKKLQYCIDFGINIINGKLQGDIFTENFNKIKNSLNIYYTPTPKGTALTTIAKLAENIVEFYEE